MSTESRVAEVRPTESWTKHITDDTETPAAAPDPEPAAAPEPTSTDPAAPAPEPEPEEDDDFDEDDDPVLNELRGLREDLRPAPKPEATAAVIDEEMQALLESDDSAVRALAKRTLASERKAAEIEQKNAALEAQVNERAVQIELKGVLAEAREAIRDLKLSDRQVAAVQHYMLSDPEIARSKTFKEAATELLDLKPAPSPTPGTRSANGAAPAAAVKAATIVDAGGSAAPVRAPGSNGTASRPAPRAKNVEELVSKLGVERLRQ